LIGTVYSTYMRRSLIWLILLVLPFVSTFAFGDGTDPDACSLVPKAQIADILKVRVDSLSIESSNPDNGHARCVYKSMRHVVGGSDAIAGLLELDYFHLGSPADTKKQIAGWGSEGLTVKTADGPQADTAHETSQSTDSKYINLMPGFAVTHANNFVVIGEKDDSSTFFAPHSADWSYKMQVAAFTAAGATVIGPLFADACVVVPQNDLQTLLTLDAATMKAETDSIIKQSRDDCRLYAYVGNERKGNIDIKINRNLSASQIREKLGDGTLSNLVQTSDLDDKVAVPAGTRGKAYAVHGSTLAEIEVEDSDPEAIVHPSFAYRVQRAALQLAGATVQPTTKYGPDPVAQTPKPPPPPSAMDKILAPFKGSLDFIWVLLPIGIVGLFVLGSLRKARLRRRLLQVGIAASARIESVSDTGVTINDNPRVLFLLTITPSNGGPPYSVSITETVSRMSAPGMLVGKTVSVLIDPQDPQKVIFAQRL
jgi:hypothetical protein